MKTVSKNKIFSVTTEVDDTLLKNLRRTPELLQQANAAGADYWHEKILPRHFDKDAHGRYGYAQRAKDYLKQHRKGSKPDLVMSGTMRREMIHNRALITTATGAKLKLMARALNLAPAMPENSADRYVTHRARGGGSRTYPNLKREVKIVLEEEREAIAQVVARTMQEGIKPNK